MCVVQKCGIVESGEELCLLGCGIWEGCVYVVYKQCPCCMCSMCVYVKTVYGMCVLYRYCGVCVVFDLCDVYFVYVMYAC